MWVSKTFIGVPSEVDLYQMVSSLPESREFYLTVKGMDSEDEFEGDIPALYREIELYYQDDSEVWIRIEVAA